MKTYKFKTNINCGSCIKSVTPHLNELDIVESWQVDTSDPDKILTVEIEDAGGVSEVKEAVASAGFKIEETES